MNSRVRSPGLILRGAKTKESCIFVFKSRFSIARELAPAAYRPETCLRDSAVFSRELSDGGRGGWHA